MKIRTTNRLISSTGFTLIEILLTGAIAGVVFVMATSALLATLRCSQTGSSQMRFIRSARITQQRITGYIQQGKAVGIEGDHITIMTTNYTVARVYYHDKDGDSNTMQDNCIMYDPDIYVLNDEVTVCPYVSSIAGETMFAIVPLGLSSAKFCFHIGDGTNTAQSADTGQGYQGVEVRFSATPEIGNISIRKDHKCIMNKNVKNLTRKGGFALVTTLALALITTAALLGFMLLCSNELFATRRALDYQKAKIAAEAGLEYGILKMNDIVLAYQFQLSTNSLQILLNQISSPPKVGDYEYLTPNGQSAFRITAETEAVSGEITEGTACRGQIGKYQYFTVHCGACNPKTGVGAVLEQSLQAVSVFMIRFGVFYENDLEIAPGPNMTFAGPVHCNSDLYLNAGATSHFKDRVTSHGDIYRGRKDSSSVSGTVLIDDDTTCGVPMIESGVTYDSNHENWMTAALERWDGRVLSKVHGVPKLNPPIDEVDNPHDMIERPLDPTDPAYNELTEGEKFSNKAGIIIHAHADGTVTAIDYFGNDLSSRLITAVLVTNGVYNGKLIYKKNSNYTYEMAVDGCYDTGKTNFWDMRENCRMASLDIYVDELLVAFPELYSGTNLAVNQGRGVVYLTRDDPDGAGTGMMPAVRLRNGRDLPPGGLSFVSDLPMYVEGHFNVDDDPHIPALVGGDAVTFLSKDWQDAKSADSNCNNRKAKNTEYNTVVMTGNEETSLGNYNGGLENVLRFLEKWSGKTVTYRGSIICIWYTEVAAGAWGCGQYYKPPNRDWGYDEIYRTEAPPGMTRVFGLEELTRGSANWSSF